MAKLTHAFQIRASDEFVRRVDDWRRQQPDIPNRADAFRRLVELGLASDKVPSPARKRPRPARLDVYPESRMVLNE